MRDNCNTPEIRDRIEYLRSIIGGDLAFFVACAWFDVPYHPEIAAGGWSKYLSRVDARGETAKGFIDGETSVDEALKSGQSDVERWESEWGLGADDAPYTTSDYHKLDASYRSYVERRRDSGGVDGQMEDTFRFCCRAALRRDKLIQKGGKDNIAEAKSLNDMISKSLADENLRRKDAAEKEQTVRLDGILEAAAKKFGLSIFSSYDDTAEAIAKWINETGRYPHTRDAADKAITAIVNCTRGNSDLPPIRELPESQKLTEYDDEFDNSPEAVEEEKDIYEYFGLSRSGGE